jgi:hypothetical protein
MDEIERPRIRVKTSHRVIELADKWCSKNKELRRLQENYDAHKNWPDSRELEKAIQGMQERAPRLRKELRTLAMELNEEKFKAVMGEDMARLRKRAKGAGDKNSWLMLLRWDIEYLEDDQLRYTIYDAHQKMTDYAIKSLFLVGVQHLLEKALKKVNKKPVEVEDLLEETLKRINKELVEVKPLLKEVLKKIGHKPAEANRLLEEALKRINRELVEVNRPLNEVKSFLVEVGHIIATPKAPHGQVDLARYEAIMTAYEPGKKHKKILAETILIHGKPIDEKFLERIGLSKKKKALEKTTQKTGAKK